METIKTIKPLRLFRCDVLNGNNWINCSLFNVEIKKLSRDEIVMSVNLFSPFCIFCSFTSEDKDKIFA